MTRNLILIAATVSALTLAGCSGGGGGGASTTSTPAAVTATQTTTSTTVAPTTTIDVTPCLTQAVAGRSVASIVVPDVLTLNMSQPSGFPNGRIFTDPVIDEELAALFLNVSVEGVGRFAALPLDPAGSGETFTGVFPYLAVANGGAPAATGGGGFTFRTDASTAYARVDRMGAPAVSTALIDQADKPAYNDDSPAVDVTDKWVPVITTDLTALTTALAAQLKAGGFTTCANVTTSG